MCINDSKVCLHLAVAVRARNRGRLTDTLIVWTEPDGVDYALSFQDPEGCAEVWQFIQDVQKHIILCKSLVYIPSNLIPTQRSAGLVVVVSSHGRP